MVRALLRLGVVGVRRIAALYMFIVAMAVCLTFVAMLVPHVLPSASELGVHRAFAYTDNDFAAARRELSVSGFTGCVYNIVPGKVAQVVCVPRELWFIEATLVLLLWLGLVTVAMVKQWLVVGVGCLLLRYGFEKLHARLVRRREREFAAAMANPYWKG